MAGLRLNSQPLSNRSESFQILPYRKNLFNHPSLKFAPKLGFSNRQKWIVSGAHTDSSSSSGADLSVTVNGLRLPNPFVIGSGPPGTNYTVMKKAFDEGWGGVIAKTVGI